MCIARLLRLLSRRLTTPAATTTNGTSQATAQGGSAVPWKAGGTGVNATNAGNDSDSDSSAESMDIEEYSSD